MGDQSWWFVLIVVVVIISAGVGFYLDKKRTERLTAFAASRGLSYVKWNDAWARVDLGWPHGIGRSHRARHVMSGAHNGRPLVIFEHLWVTGSGKNRQSHRAMVCALELPRAFPKLVVGPEGFFGGLARRMGLKDIELESDDFNRAFKVSSDDRRFATDILHPRFMQWMLAHGGGGFTMSGSYLVCARSAALHEGAVDSFIGYLDAIAAQVPAFVWHQP